MAAWFPFNSKESEKGGDDVSMIPVKNLKLKRSRMNSNCIYTKRNCVLLKLLAFFTFFPRGVQTSLPV
jgi:hypothetical protein